MNIGYYVRTKKGIAKIIGRVNDPTNYFYKFWICDRYLELYKDTEYIQEKDIIGEPSSNIKDLIKAGDFITYRHINMYWNIPTSVYAKYKDDETTLMVDDYTLNEIEILSIVTKEQFESMEYKINE